MASPITFLSSLDMQGHKSLRPIGALKIEAPDTHQAIHSLTEQAQAKGASHISIDFIICSFTSVSIAGSCYIS